MTDSDITKRAPHVLAELASGEARDLRTLQAKLTFVGPRKKSVPSLVITTYHHVVRMDWFPPSHPAGDDLVAWHIITTPDEMKSIVASLARLRDVFQTSEPQLSPHVSLTMALKESRLGDLAFEAILDSAGSKSVFDAIDEGIDQTNGLARTVIELQRQIVFGSE